MDRLIQAAERESPASTKSADESHLARPAAGAASRGRFQKVKSSTLQRNSSKVFVVLLLAETLECWLQKCCRAARTSGAASRSTLSQRRCFGLRG
ncbi:Hypothetical predicted protein [Scomber scombrus]